MSRTERTQTACTPAAGALAFAVLLTSLSAALCVAQEGPAGEAPWDGFAGAEEDDEAASIRDPRAEQILDDTIRAHGGSEAIRARETIFIKYKITNYSSPEPVTGTLTLWFKRPYFMRREVSYPQKKQTVIFDGESAWVDDGNGPERLAPFASAIVKRGIDEMDGPLQYKQGSLKYLDTSPDPMGRMTQRLSWRHEGYARDLMVDATNYRLLVIGSFETPSGAISRMQIFDDYRSVDGILVPYRKEVILNNERYSESTVLDVRFNGKIDAALFKPAGQSTAHSGMPKPQEAVSPH